MRQYKNNLSVVNSRYGDVEKRVLEFFADDPGNNAIQLPGGFNLLLRNLIKDELLEEMPIHSGVTIAGMGSHEFFAITDAGREFIDLWLRAKDLEQT